MWIVRVALRRPYTFVVLALLILMVGPLTILRTPTDIFPNIDIPVVSAIWSYAGLSAQEMANRITTVYERDLTTTVNDIEHIESQSLRGISSSRSSSSPGRGSRPAIAQMSAQAQSALRQMPPGTQPPFMLTYNASSVPVLQLGLSGEGLSEQQLFDLGINFIRTQLATVPGASIPYPYGGKQPQIQVDLDPDALQRQGAVADRRRQRDRVAEPDPPGGHGEDRQLRVRRRAQRQPADGRGAERPADQDDRPLADLHPRRRARPRTAIRRRPTSCASTGSAPSLLTIQKIGNASTLDIISRVKAALPRIAASMPPQLQIRPLLDQSLFVRASIQGVVREAIIAGCLTALMILIFLGSWRSTVIIAVSIPLSILTSIIVLSALGETINIMTLGGLALAVGILVDDATVAIENINRHLEQGKELEPAILDGAEQIAIPAFVSTLCICIVFVPMFFLTGVARYLFVPMAEAVVFAMLASYVLSRTLVPTMAKYLLHAHERDVARAPARQPQPVRAAAARGSTAASCGCATAYRGALETARRAAAAGSRVVFLAGCVASLALVPWVGEDFFPTRRHAASSSCTCARRPARASRRRRALCDHVDAGDPRRSCRPASSTTIIDNIGLPYSGINLSYTQLGADRIGATPTSWSRSTADHHPTDGYVHDLRLRAGARVPGRARSPSSRPTSSRRS